jgi:CheY-like chemotaxis protein
MGGDARVVMVVDDDEGVRYGVRALLEALGCDVIEAVDGAGATALFDANAERIALVLLDREMPGMAGDEVLAALRARRPDVRIVVTSGHDLGNAPRGTRVLAKPFGIDELEALLAEG